MDHPEPPGVLAYLAGLAVLSIGILAPIVTSAVRKGPGLTTRR